MTGEPDEVRDVADAVLYEGYLLYPYRATASKNQSRWQFGVLSPPGAADAGLGEDYLLSSQIPVCGAEDLQLTVRFLQLQHRSTERVTAGGHHEPVERLDTPGGSWVTWDEAVEVEQSFTVVDLGVPVFLPVAAAAHTEIEVLDGGRLVRDRGEVLGSLDVEVQSVGPADLVTITVRNCGPPALNKEDSMARSMIGTHVIAHTESGSFVSLLEPPPHLQATVDRCRQHRCFPVLAGAQGSTHTMLVSPIILYDYPEIAQQSRTALFDSTEIDEILTLRVMAMTDEEKAQARATDPLAARVIDRCDGISAEAMLGLHGVCRDPRSIDPPAASVRVAGVTVSAGSRVRLRPSRRADAQDMFVAGKTARVASVLEDLDGDIHVAVVLDDDPAADLHDWYGRYLYFSPEEIEPLSERSPTWT
ncbi:MAG: hypothetical protein WBB07_22125 [Mycobacterium sp.]